MNILDAIQLLLNSTLWAIGSVVSMFICLILFVLIVAPKMSGRARYIDLNFAWFPTIMSNNKLIWLKYYYSYKTFGHGVSLGSAVVTTYSKDKKYVYYSQRNGSFFPTTKAEWKNDVSYFGLRSFLRKKPHYRNKYRQQQEGLENFLKTANFLGKDPSWIDENYNNLKNKGRTK